MAAFTSLVSLEGDLTRRWHHHGTAYGRRCASCRVASL